MNPENIAVMVPMVAIVLGLTIPILGMSLEYRMKKDLFELHHKERMAAIDKGLDVPPLPPELFRPQRKPSTPASLLRLGLILVLGGAGLAVAMSYAFDTLSLWGLIPVGVGLAYLVSFLYERKQPHG
jgi:hypothetical protein